MNATLDQIKREAPQLVARLKARGLITIAPRLAVSITRLKRRGDESGSGPDAPMGGCLPGRQRHWFKGSPVCVHCGKPKFAGLTPAPQP